jgi:hypothetical protein
MNEDESRKSCTLFPSYIPETGNKMRDEPLLFCCSNHGHLLATASAFCVHTHHRRQKHHCTHNLSVILAAISALLLVRTHADAHAPRPQQKQQSERANERTHSTQTFNQTFKKQSRGKNQIRSKPLKRNNSRPPRSPPAHKQPSTTVCSAPCAREAQQQINYLCRSASLSPPQHTFIFFFFLC